MRIKLKYMLIKHKYKYLIIINLVLGILLSANMQAQNVTLPDSLIVRNTPKKGLVFDYKIKKGNTIYSISKAFKADIIDIYAFNSGLNLENLKIGLDIVIPFDIQLLDNTSTGKKHIVYYKVGKKENLFRIAKMYFGQDVDKVKRLNKMADNTIHPGQLLKIGEVDYIGNTIVKTKIEDKQKKIEPKKEIIVKDSIVKKVLDKEKMEFEKVIIVEIDTSVLEKDTLVKEPVVLISDSGMALWNKQSRTKGLFVLSNTAKLNSLMEINNPLVGRKIFAKVLGRIPPNSYSDNVMLILSPQAADSLGAINSKFFVRIKYSKK